MRRWVVVDVIAVGALALLGVSVLILLVGRPQRGLLAVAALAPLHGLLLLVPGGSALASWKEILLGLTLLATFLGRSQRAQIRPAMPWWPAAAALLVFGSLSALITLGIAGLIAIKITFFYMIIPVILYRSPFNSRDRDHLVSIMMVMGLFVSTVGIWQQIVGPDALANLGYAWNDQIRTSHGVLRSFSTFTSPFPFGFFVMLVLIVGGAVALGEPRRMRSQIFLCATPVLVLGMGMSIVRASIVGLIVGIAWLALHRYRTLWGLLGAVVASVPMVVLLFQSSALSALGSAQSFDVRSTGWRSITSRFFLYPFGQGLGSTGEAAVRSAEGFDPDAGRPESVSVGVQDLVDGTAYQPDNYFVKVGLELGPVGLWIFGLLLIAVISFTLRTAKQLSGRDSAFAIGVSASIVAASVASVFSTYFEIFPMDVYFWLLLGAVGCATTSARYDLGRSRSGQTVVGSPPTHAS